MKTVGALGGGVAGAAAFTLLHETVRRIVPQAPRMDLLGMNAISKGLDAAGWKKPKEEKLFTWALAGDLVTNSLYYSMAGVGREKNAWVRASLLGLAAGIGAVALPESLGLDKRHSNRSTSTKLMTIGIYVAGALITAAIMKWADKRKQQKHEKWEERLVTSGMS